MSNNHKYLICQGIIDQSGTGELIPLKQFTDKAQAYAYFETVKSTPVKYTDVPANKYYKLLTQVVDAEDTFKTKVYKEKLISMNKLSR